MYKDDPKETGLLDFFFYKMLHMYDEKISTPASSDLYHTNFFSVKESYHQLF